MKFYIASKLENAETVTRLANILKAAGHTHTYDWTEHGSVTGESEERIRQVASAETKGVLDAGIIIVILPGGRGTHAELGIAIGTKKNIVICAEEGSFFEQDDRTCVFYWTWGTRHILGTLDKWAAGILEYMRVL